MTRSVEARKLRVLVAVTNTRHTERKSKCRPTAGRATAEKSTAARVVLGTVIVRGIRRQRGTLIDIPQLSVSELRAVIRNRVCADLAWAELKRRGDTARYVREVLLPKIKRDALSDSQETSGKQA